MFIGLAETKAELNTRLEQIVARDDLLATVHGRLAKYEEDFLARCFIEPLTRRVASIHRSILDNLRVIEQQIEKLPSRSGNARLLKWCYKNLRAIQIELENTLNLFGIEVFKSESNQFDRSCQEAVKKTPAHDTSSVGTIAERLFCGFRASERIVFRERVVVFSS